MHARRAMSVIRTARWDICACDRQPRTVRSDSRRVGRVGQAELDRDREPIWTQARARAQTGALSMIRRTSLPSVDSDREERSMRAVEYALAFAAVIAAGILAFLR